MKLQYVQKIPQTNKQWGVWKRKMQRLLKKYPEHTINVGYFNSIDFCNMTMGVRIFKNCQHENA
jgi:hypothetical protein